MMFSAMLTDAFHGCDNGIHIRYRTDGRLFISRGLRAVTKKAVCRKRRIASHRHVATSGSPSAKKKTEVMYAPRPGKPNTQPHTMVKGLNLQTVDQFTYLGSIFTTANNIDAEINNRIAKASSAFRRMREKIWERRGISTTTKLKVYKAVVLTTLRYACETWTVYRRHANQLNHFHMSCLRRFLRIRWQDMVPDTEIMRRANLQTIFTLFQKAQVRWTGHTVRLNDDRLPTQLLYGELSTGLEINVKSLEKDTLDRPTWRSQISIGAKAAETKRIAAAKKKQAERKGRAANPPTTSAFSCSTCGKDFIARIGLISHL
ncbi:hypothetical protein HOLleu_04263 [Holothuria leucospilota]|uniref:C2H2-type domain-containing protein n=1 Tax=Holothuria leucospilota TaxID=206669 RepID=A0A9Q1CU93_HOLLE|nr:hypothetical protein HOLleu_04263 [Holothuria leucospilota]